MKKSHSHILVVDDDQEIRILVARQLRRHGFVVDVAANGIEMRNILGTARIDLVVLDRIMPGEDGLTLCQELRTTSNIPVIMLTLLGSETDRIVGLEMGADDYIPKPFNPQELIARIRAVLRRANELPINTPDYRDRRLRFSGWTLDGRARRLTAPDGSIVTLTDGEFDLLKAFAERAGVVLNRDQLLDLTSGRQPGLFDRSIDMQIARLRRKLAAYADANEFIKTIRQRGYMFSADVVEADE
ncbi:Transcriptional regulatory protein OmpR [Candidatus Filomicrobium marinum]|uniref:Regulatory protein VirG n=1 Tax=Candidatus Filomicrobium marinum TaxID=1608628 RepID=A0A0D6JG04_9HYPH|nr:response regulator [Candidatus Filomicrobium marinum]CFX23733.1 Transcriptional regulatory protein OmpR [Candidatus Filomicrobium marinum]CPR19084.1 Transcriptional regulatory protein OmpR [Candidatus Filomicrobium marinum]